MHVLENLNFGPLKIIIFRKYLPHKSIINQVFSTLTRLLLVEKLAVYVPLDELETRLVQLLEQCKHRAQNILVAVIVAAGALR